MKNETTKKKKKNMNKQKNNEKKKREKEKRKKRKTKGIERERNNCKENGTQIHEVNSDIFMRLYFGPIKNTTSL